MKTILSVFASAVLAVATMSAAPFQADRSGKTSDNQKNNKADVDLTAQIRKEVVANKSLSAEAHNVQIISENGSVTVRGDVKSADEKATILQIARKVAGASNVMDQITVVPPKS